ncbi:MAG: alpha/beta hydrolase [Deinococcota bacterium]
MIFIQLGAAFTQTTITTDNGDETVTIALEHGGNGPPLLLLHGYPQTHIMWHKLAPRLANHYHVICPDLRGYGDSSKPISKPNYVTYSKKAMSQDMMQVMAALGYSHFFAAGHDRGARVLHRLARDYPHALDKLCLMDIVPTLHMFQTVDQSFATSYYHWFFLIQPDNLPERMIAADPSYYLHEKLQRWSQQDITFDAKFDEATVAEYVRCFQAADTLRATCDDYRAAASIDLEHDNHDQDSKIICPLLILWGKHGFIEKNYDVLDIWKQHTARNTPVVGEALNCGHFLPEEVPDDVYNALFKFFTTG